MKVYFKHENSHTPIPTNQHTHMPYNYNIIIKLKTIYIHTDISRPSNPSSAERRWQQKKRKQHNNNTHKKKHVHVVTRRTRAHKTQIAYTKLNNAKVHRWGTVACRAIAIRHRTADCIRLPPNLEYIKTNATTRG